MAEQILIVDDEQAFREMLCEAVEARGWEACQAGSAEEGLELLKKYSADVILLDVRLPGMSGLDAMSSLREADPGADIIIMTAHGGRDAALQAVKRGAYDFFNKPFSLAEMEIVIRRALEKRRLQHQISNLRRNLKQDGPLRRIIGNSEAMTRVINQIERVAPLDTTVLITGESGTGKELISDTLHALSPRNTGPFVKINCAAIPDTLMEGELFGHEKGAFTGANATRKGKFEMASGGAIMLDEIGDMPLHLQPKLLRAVEQKQIERLGGSRTISIDTRIIAATNQKLAERVREKKFRDDLYYRLNVAAIVLPPLRERKDDLPLLADHFLREINARIGTRITGLSIPTMAVLYDYNWPGNVRQLANVLERAAIYCKGDVIEPVDIQLDSGPVEIVSPAGVLQNTDSMVASEEVASIPAVSPEEALPENIDSNSPVVEIVEGKNLKATLQEVERGLLEQALVRANGVQTDAAKYLGITPKNLWNKIKKHGIEVKTLHT